MAINTSDQTALLLTPLVGVGYHSPIHTFSVNDILGDFNGTTYAEDSSIIATGGTGDVSTLTDKDGNLLSPIDSEFGFKVFDFFEAIPKERDNDYQEGWAGNIVGETGAVVGLALVNAETDLYKSGQPLGTWAAGLGGNTVKASTEQYAVMAALLSDQAHAASSDGNYIDPGADYSLDNNLKIISYERNESGNLIFDENGDLIPTELHDKSVQEVLDLLSALPVGADPNGDGVLDIRDILAPNENSVTENIAYSKDYSVTLKDDGKLLYRWGTAIKRPNDIRTQVQIGLPESWMLDADLNGDGVADVTQINDGKGYQVTRAELVIHHNITNNPNDQIRPEDYENEAATGRKPSYYIVEDPDQVGNTLWVSPVNSYAGDRTFLPSYLKLTDSGDIDLEAGGQAIFAPDGSLMGYRNSNEAGEFIGTIFKDESLIELNEGADLPFSSADIESGFTNAWYTSTDRDPFEWSYDRYADDPYRQVFLGFSSREEAEAAGLTDEQLVSGPRWRLTSNKFGQNIPGVELPLVPNSQPPFKKDNIRYPVGEATTTVIHLLDWAGESPLAYSNGWTTIDPGRLDENGDGEIDDGWRNLVYDDSGNLIQAISPNGLTLSPEFFDVAVYLKGDRRDSAKIYDIQLKLEYEADPAVIDLFDYGDAPDNDGTFNYQAYDTQDIARARILPGFYLGTPLEIGEEGLIGTPEIDAEDGALVSSDALGDDTTHLDDEGGITFLTPILPGQTAAISVSASLQEYLFATDGSYTSSNPQPGYLFGWIDFDGSGTWNAAEQLQFQIQDPLGNILGTTTGATLANGTQTLYFEVPESVQTNLETFARFRLSPVSVGAYGEVVSEELNIGEVEDYPVLVSNPYDDVIGQKEDGSWWVGLSNGDKFESVQYGQWATEGDWSQTVAADLNGDGMDDIAAYDLATGMWGVGVTEYDGTKTGLDRWSFNSNETYSSQAPWQEALAVDFNGDRIDEVVGRTADGTWQLLPADEGGFDANGLPTWSPDTFTAIHVGDFEGSGQEQVAGLEQVNGTQQWSVLSYGAEGFSSELWQEDWIPFVVDTLTGDFNGDGLDDIAGQDPTGQWFVSLSTGNIFTASEGWGGILPAWEGIDTGDFNGDGRDDLVLFNPDEASWHVGISNGTSFTFGKRPSRWNVARNWTDLQVADFTGDGITDVAARRDNNKWVVGTYNGRRIVRDFFGKWDKTAEWKNVVSGNFDGGLPEVVIPETLPLDDTPMIDESGVLPAAVDPGLVNDVDTPLNQTPTYRVSQTFEVGDIIGGFDGATYANNANILDLNTTKLTKDGVVLYAIDSEFGFTTTDFEGAEQKSLDGKHEEGWAGNLFSDPNDPNSDVLGLVVANSPTSTFQTPYLLGTWLEGMGGEAVKASTEHYVTMQNVLSDQYFPDDPDAVYPLDNNLIVVGGDFAGQSVSEAIAQLELAGDDRNGDGVYSILDVLAPNESSITQDIAVSDDYSVTLKDDGKLLYRWGNLVKRPTDIRVRTQLDLPTEWQSGLFEVTEAELVVRHTISNNPNDQIRPEDYENEAAKGRLPNYVVNESDQWVSTEDFYTGDGTLLPAGTILRDPAIVANSETSTLDTIGALSSDLQQGFTNAWYTTQDREPFEPVLEGDSYEVGPRWRLKSNKYGQDLPGVEIPDDPTQPPPPTKEEIKYEVGAETQTVINLLDWSDPLLSPLRFSSGWQKDANTVSENGLKLTENFDVAFYVKGDQKPVVLYDAELVMTYDAVDIFGIGAAITGTSANDVLAGAGGNTFEGGLGNDTFILSYGSTMMSASTILDFNLEEDIIGLINLGVTEETFATHLTQETLNGDLALSLNGSALATLVGVESPLDIDHFYLA